MPRLTRRVAVDERRWIEDAGCGKELDGRRNDYRFPSIYKRTAQFGIQRYRFLEIHMLFIVFSFVSFLSSLVLDRSLPSDFCASVLVGAGVPNLTEEIHDTSRLTSRRLIPLPPSQVRDSSIRMCCHGCACSVGRSAGWHDAAQVADPRLTAANLARRLASPARGPAAQPAGSAGPHAHRGAACGGEQTGLKQLTRLSGFDSDRPPSLPPLLRPPLLSIVVANRIRSGNSVRPLRSARAEALGDVV